MDKRIVYIFISTAIVLFLCIVLVYYIGIGPHHSLVNLISLVTSAEDSGYPFKGVHEVKGTKGISVNENSLRLSLRSSENELVILAGGSNLFGWGVSKEDTIFNKLKKYDLEKNKSFITYAYPGWGPHNLLSRFDRLNSIELRKYKNSTFIYFMLDIHFERVCGSPYYYMWSSGASPRFEIIDNKLVNTGLSLKKFDFHQLMFQFGFYKILDFWGIEKLPFETDMKVAESKSCQNLFKEVIKQLISKYKQNSPTGKFVILYYLYIPNNKLIKKLQEELGVDFVSLREISEIDETEKKFFQEDGHFSPMANQVIAKAIWESIFNRGEYEVKD